MISVVVVNVECETVLHIGQVPILVTYKTAKMVRAFSNQLRIRRK